MNWHVRDANETDAEAIMKVHIDCILKICSSHYSEDQVQRWAKSQSLERYISFINMGDSFVVVEDKNSNSVVAFAHMGKKCEGDFSAAVDFEVYGFYVSPCVSRKGLGKMLYGVMESRALKEGARGIGVKSSLNAVAFYEACGFRLTGMGATVIGGRDVELECKHLEKVLHD